MTRPRTPTCRARRSVAPRISHDQSSDPHIGPPPTRSENGIGLHVHVDRMRLSRCRRTGEPAITARATYAQAPGPWRRGTYKTNSDAAPTKGTRALVNVLLESSSCSQHGIQAQLTLTHLRSMAHESMATCFVCAPPLFSRSAHAFARPCRTCVLRHRIRPRLHGSRATKKLLACAHMLRKPSSKASIRIEHVILLFVGAATSSVELVRKRIVLALPIVAVDRPARCTHRGKRLLRLLGRTCHVSLPILSTARRLRLCRPAGLLAIVDVVLQPPQSGVVEGVDVDLDLLVVVAQPRHVLPDDVDHSRDVIGRERGDALGDSGALIETHVAARGGRGGRLHFGRRHHRIPT